MTSRILSIVTLLLTGAGAVADGAGLPETAADALRRGYLECERRAVSGHLSTGEIARCSVLYEELKEGVFDGDWRKVREWTEDNLLTRQPHG